MVEKILIVDDMSVNRIMLKVKLKEACHDSIQAGDGESALRMARNEQPKLILLDMMLPDISGIEVCRRLRADPATSHIPIVIITASTDRARRLEALQAGADEFLTKPLNEMILLARIRSLLRACETEDELRLRAATCGEMGFAEAGGTFEMPDHLGLVAPDPATGMQWRAMLSPFFSGKIDLLTASDALAEADGQRVPDVYVLAADLSAAGSGLRLVSDLRSRVQSRHSAICLVLPDAVGEAAAMALDLGATDLLPLPLDPEETALRLKLHAARKKRADQLRRQVQDGLRLAVADPLTGLYNRRYALAHLERVAQRARETGRRYAVMVLDLDRFKTINDTFGHAAGDSVLETVAHRLRDNLRPSDLVARIGGEEFLVALPDTTLGTARIAAERLCRAVQADPVVLPDGQDVLVTISVGLALGNDDPQSGTETVRQLIERADEALFAAKTEGRNQVTISATAA
ncbi:diguanylate cyclase [Pararhodobacter sp. SW119]|uniref:diguanylate cyclase n=1 Tax=Pararhodobacter sp. SW119 TaxID=2780075 RepID=UPI001AE006B2|nr:diguanylate cyclase [Pararhodobacter sp. SW119]